MANYEFGRDLLTDVLARGSELQIGQADSETQCRQYIHRAYWAITRSYSWLWARAYPPVQFVLAPRIDVTVSISGTAVTLPAAVGDMANRYLLVVGDGLPARIASGSGVVLTLQIPYPGGVVSGAAAYIFQNEVVVADDILVPVTCRNLINGKTVDVIGRAEFDDLHPLTESGDPTHATFVNDSVLRVGAWPEALSLLELDYVQRPPLLDFSGSTGTDTPRVPRDERWLIADYALYFLLKDDDDNRADSIGAAVAGRLAELREQQLAKMGARVWLPPQFQTGVR